MKGLFLFIFEGVFLYRKLVVSGENTTTWRAVCEISAGSHAKVNEDFKD
ncbi:hypothetical protein [Bacillus benzoevorans]|uniref:Uncharacterized protein n=1 Tax=Bacillus benzoevorans TaxID=1456 RepID=A0A7X0LYB2_9BACI|nr:hypothetical protein [Bacillus benzoevorans]MBB6447312.1 hypothetical protein [Bacillus benzoevorans]